MKRIANSCAVQTLFYVVSSKQRIRIIDGYSPMTKNNEFVLYEGTLYDYEFGGYNSKKVGQWKVDHAKIHGLDIVDGVLEIRIDTKWEEY